MWHREKENGWWVLVNSSAEIRLYGFPTDEESIEMLDELNKEEI